MKRMIKLLLTATLALTIVAPSVAFAEDEAPDIKLEQTQQDDSLGKTESTSKDDELGKTESTSKDDDLGKPEAPEKLDVTVTPGVVVDTTDDGSGEVKADGDGEGDKQTGKKPKPVKKGGKTKKNK